MSTGRASTRRIGVVAGLMLLAALGAGCAIHLAGVGARADTRERPPAPARARDGRREHRPDGRRDRRRTGRSVGLPRAAARRAGAVQRLRARGVRPRERQLPRRPARVRARERRRLGLDDLRNAAERRRPALPRDGARPTLRAHRCARRRSARRRGLHAAVWQAGRRARARPRRALPNAARTARGRAAGGRRRRRPERGDACRRQRHGRRRRRCGRKLRVTPKRISARSGAARTRA